MPETIKGGIDTLWTVGSVTWGSTEDGADKEINTINDASPKTVEIRAGVTIADLENASWVKVYNGEDISGNVAFQNIKYVQARATLRGDSSLPVLSNLSVNASEVLSSFLWMHSFYGLIV